MNNGKAVVLAGATGLVGSHLLKLLIASPEVSKLHLLLRRPLDNQHQKVEEHIVDFERLAQLEIQASHVFCALGSTIKKAGSQEKFRQVDYHCVLALGQLAAHLNAGMSLVSSLGADPMAKNFYLKTKGEAERDLQKLNLPYLGLFRPSLMHKGRQEQRFGEKFAGLVLTVVGPLLLGGLARYRAIDARQVAKAVLKEALCHDPGSHVYESNQIARL